MKLFPILALASIVFVSSASLVVAQTVTPVTSPAPRPEQTIQEATQDDPSLLDVQIQELVELSQLEAKSQATESQSLATPSAEVEQKIQEKRDEDITEPTSKQKSVLAAYLDEHPPEPLSWNNFIQHAIRGAIENGLPANIVVLILLFPVITSIIAFSRHIIGLKGFGVYTPAVLSVALVSTGIATGLVVFATILLAGLISKTVLRRFRMSYLPRTAFLLWGVSILTLLVLVIAANLGITTLLTLNIFPLLIIMLLAENFMESESFSSRKQALRLSVETVGLAIFCSLIIGAQTVQKWVILHPEISLLTVAVVNFAVSRYTGLRLLERIRFQSILEK